MIALYFGATALVAFVFGLIAAALIIRFGRGAATSSWTPENIAYNLMGTIAKQEGKSLDGKSGDRPDKKWLLDTYASACRRCASRVTGWMERNRRHEGSSFRCIQAVVPRLAATAIRRYSYQI